MSAFALLLLCLGLGALMARTQRFPRQSPAVLNAWILNIALPALVLIEIPRLQWSADLWFPILAPWVVMVGAMLLFAWLGARLGWERSLIGCVILVCGLGNTAFLGLPMIQALRGPEALATAVIADQLGSFLALSTLGMWVAARYSGADAGGGELLLRVLRFPPFLALIAGFLVAGLGGWPPAAEQVLARLAETLAPLALFSVGMQFRLRALRESRQAAALGLGWKLLLAPAILAGLAWSLGLAATSSSVGVLQAAMAPMITAGILASEHDLKPALASALVSLGILLSFVSVPLWHLLLG